MEKNVRITNVCTGVFEELKKLDNAELRIVLHVLENDSLAYVRNEELCRICGMSLMELKSYHFNFKDMLDYYRWEDDAEFYTSEEFEEAWLELEYKEDLTDEEIDERINKKITDITK